MKKKSILLSLSNDYYFEGLLVMIKSFLNHNGNWFNGEIHVLDIGISLANLDRLPAFVLIHRIEAPLTFGNDWHFETFAKFEIFKFATHKNVLYLDADLVVLRNVESFFNLPEGLHAFPDFLNGRRYFDTCVMYLNEVCIDIYDRIVLNFKNEIENLQLNEKYNFGDDVCTFNVPFTPINSLFYCKKKVNEVIDIEGEVSSENDFFLDTPFYKWWDGGKKYKYFYLYGCNKFFKNIHHLIDSKKQSDILRKYLVMQKLI